METLIHILTVIMVITVITILWFRYRLTTEKNFRRFYTKGRLAWYFDGEERKIGTVVKRNTTMTLIKSVTGPYVWILNENLYSLLGVDYSKNKTNEKNINCIISRWDDDLCIIIIFKFYYRSNFLKKFKYTIKDYYYINKDSSTSEYSNFY